MKVTIEYDTVSKQLSVTEDGTPMPAVDYINFYKCYEPKDGFHMEIVQSATNDEQKVTKRVSTMAKVFGFVDEN